MSAAEQVAQISPSRSGPEGTAAEAIERVGRLVADPESSGDALAEEISKLPAGREAASFLVRALEEKLFGSREDGQGMPLKYAAVEALIEMGFPYALEVPPEELEGLRGFEQKRKSVVGLLVLFALWAVPAAWAAVAGVTPLFFVPGVAGFLVGTVGAENRQALRAGRLLLTASALLATLAMALPFAPGPFEVKWSLALLSWGGLLGLQRRARKLSARLNRPKK